MALTKIYKVGEIMFIDETGASKIEKIRVWTVDSDATNVYVYDKFHDSNQVKLHTFPIADVRDKADGAIGGQTQAEVEEYVADPTT